MSAGVALAAPPANDDINNATVVGALPFTDNINTAEATTAADDPNCFGRGPTVWYVYTPADDLTIVAHTFGSDYDTTLSAYTGSPGALTQIACNDDAGFGLQSAIAIEVEAGTTYYFMVGAFADGPGGDLVFNVLDAADVVAPQLDVTIDASGQFGKDGSATVTGTATCNEGDFAFIDVELVQRVGRVNIRGFGGAFIFCDGTAQPWSAEVFSDNGLFKGGRATASVFAESCGVFDCAFDFEQRTISLKK